MALTREQRETELKKLERVDALELALNYFVEDDSKLEFLFFVMLEFVDEKKMVVDTKKVTIATKKISYEAFTVLQKAQPLLDDDVCAQMHKIFGLRMNSGRKKYKIPPVEVIVAPWADAINARLADDDQYLAELDERTTAVNASLAKKKMGPALKAALKDPPVKCRNLDIKSRTADVVYRVLRAVPSKSIEKQVKNLDSRQLDDLMRYVYRGLSTPGNASTLLKWHAALVSAGGLGVISRVLCGPTV